METQEQREDRLVSESCRHLGDGVGGGWGDDNDASPVGFLNVGNPSLLDVEGGGQDRRAREGLEGLGGDKGLSRRRRRHPNGGPKTTEFPHHVAGAVAGDGARNTKDNMTTSER